jgi:N-acetyl-anhydromuramyl-L-alanine amidase AmpD
MVHHPDRMGFVVHSAVLAALAAGAGSGGAAAGDAPVATAAERPRPTIVQRPIPYGAERRKDMAAYAERHYGTRTARLKPRVIVQHFTANTSFRATWDIFARNVRDPELHELPGTCAHFVVDRDGTIYQLVPITRMCRHTVGLNHVAIGIEHVGLSDGQVMGNARQRTASLRLTAWLRCREGIAVRDVIGHNENRGHRLHRERVARLRTQSHEDFSPATSRRYRQLLRSRSC